MLLKHLFKTNYLILILVTALIFIFDLQLPIDVSSASIYVATILITLWETDNYTTLILAIITSILGIIGLLFSPAEAGEMWKGVLNSAIALCSIWITTVLVIVIKRDLKLLNIYKQQLRVTLTNSLLNKQRLNAVLAASLDPLIAFDAKLDIHFVSKSIYTVFGWDEKEIIGKNIKLLVNSDNLESWFKENIEKRNSSKPTLEVLATRKSGETFTCEITIGQVILPNKDESLFTAILRDITERRLFETKLYELSIIDELCNVYNRRYFNERLALEWRRMRRKNKLLVLAMLDIDYFKNYNDALGHQAGDDCLKSIAASIKSQLGRASDFVARYGGEEFAILLAEDEAIDYKKLFINIKDAIYNLDIKHPDSKISDRVTISLGVATIIPNNSSTMDDFIKLADLALYNAKHSGRNQVYFE